VSTELLSEEGIRISSSRTSILAVKKGSNRTLVHYIPINLTRSNFLLTNVTDLALYLNISMNVAKMLPIIMVFEEPVNVTWLPPLHDLKVLTNVTEDKLLLSIYFKNLNPWIWVNGTLEIRVFNEEGEEIWKESLLLNERPAFGGEVDSFSELLEISVEGYTGRGYLVLAFDATLFRYELEVPYGPTGG
jgi:hypothetical protein